ncbi:MAG: 2-oxoacid:acceptor oxidoreductase subunit alpha [Candidatus Omnitrophica bacterium]|nr:2-oxoacid:acceptor oxidoreductase subunit alpha [Candidatus Omnitrophota bacterium]
MSRNNDMSVRITGEAGQGIKTIGHALCEIFVKAGYNIFANMDYMSRIRGGNNYFQIRISSSPVHALREAPDIVVALNAESVSLHSGALSEGGLLFADIENSGVKEKEARLRDAPFFRIAEETGSEIYVSAVSCGLIAGITGIDFRHVESVLEKYFGKDEEIRDNNIKAGKKGYALAGEKFKEDIHSPQTSEEAGKYLLNGTEAMAMGAIRAGCKFYSAYPMTPATGVMLNMAKYADDFNILVEQAEDEIAAVNMAIGASFAGARAMTATSGGGLCLMAEGISLAGMTETPVVIVDAQRPAPATGLPTRTEQGDLELAIYGCHGEFPRAVLAPGSIEECYRLTLKAFELADKYQIPVLVLTDQYLADSLRDIKALGGEDTRVRKFSLSRDESSSIKEYKRYELTDTGISPRAIPSWLADVIYADSDEHTEEGHITESDTVRNSMVDKRLYRKGRLLAEEVIPPEVSGPGGAETILVGFGSTRGVINEVRERKGGGYGALHLPQVWPFPAEAVRKTLEGRKKVICIENNASAQLAGLIRKKTGIEVSESILKYDGRPFNTDILTERI